MRMPDSPSMGLPGDRLLHPLRHDADLQERPACPLGADGAACLAPRWGQSGDFERIDAAIESSASMALRSMIEGFEERGKAMQWWVVALATAALFASVVQTVVAIEPVRIFGAPVKTGGML